MMTAAQVAHGLGRNGVTINYRASKVRPQYFQSENPMPELSFTKHSCDFRGMQTAEPKYESEQYFPAGVHISEPRAPADYKAAVFSPTAETGD